MSTNLIPLSGAAAVAVGEALTQAAARTGRQFDELAVRQWIYALAGCEAEEVRQAFRSHAATQDHAPSIAAVLREIDRMRFGGVSGAWTQFLHAARAVRYTGGAHFVVFEHPAIHFAIESLGGWGHLQDQLRDAARVGLMRRDFIAAFDDYRVGSFFPAGFGHFSGDNVVLIGHAARALIVYRGGVKGEEHELVPGVATLYCQTRLHVGESLRNLPNELLPAHFAAPPGPPIRIPPPWEPQGSDALSVDDAGDS